ncbi:hypothetical protein [Photobacterium sp. OFAV2-7]|uniref:hypothetical protein n=1 Tax=Photobacterium sp. OFAV2-7 TaxID=2917748 RepID=UPI001EF471BF|nr:hypothetical protein [Photobacterium sp. OFAV2-7]MCG7588779.1 hypothetical protein [Photobacterium sp. OFAV2-7]
MITDYLPRQLIAVAAGYQEGNTHVHVVSAELYENNKLGIWFPKSHTYSTNDLITLHLDNRTGVDIYDAELEVYRASYKGKVISISGNRLMLAPLETMVFYGNKCIYKYQAEEYTYPCDTRPEVSLKISPQQKGITPDDTEFENKVGVLITQALEQPHTTVMAFLSSTEDDIFMITYPNSFKGQLLARDTHCIFAIDNRNTFTFETHIDWNYTLISAEAFRVEKNSQLFTQVQDLFIAKNPWEAGFFLADEIEMYHLKSKGVVCNQALIANLL